MKFMKPLVGILLLVLVSCGVSIPQPCDPEVANAAMAAMAAACRTKAEADCPGYADMTEEQKLSCPGVSKCMARIESVEVSCHGN